MPGALCARNERQMPLTGLRAPGEYGQSRRQSAFVAVQSSPPAEMRRSLCSIALLPSPGSPCLACWPFHRPRRCRAMTAASNSRRRRTPARSTARSTRTSARPIAAPMPRRLPTPLRHRPRPLPPPPRRQRRPPRPRRRLPMTANPTSPTPSMPPSRRRPPRPPPRAWCSPRQSTPNIRASPPARPGCTPASTSITSTRPTTRWAG